MIDLVVRQRRAAAVAAMAVVLAAAGVSGCGASATTSERPPAPRVPELTLTVASLDLTGLNRRIEKSDVSGLAKILKREQVELFAVQNVSRYPGLSARVDLISELARQADWRQAFGEMMDNSGHQTGNAVFSMYPIRSSDRLSFDGVKGVLYEGAVQAVVDGGVRDLMLVSAHLPQKASAEDRAQCIGRITALRSGLNLPLIVAGNLPEPGAGFEEATPSAAKGRPSSRLQFAGGDDVQLLSATTASTPLGVVVVARLALYRQQRSTE